MWRWPDPCNNADACCKQQWNKDTRDSPADPRLGRPLKLTKLLFVTSEADKLFLTWEVCKALRMISENFPTVGEALHLSKAMALDEDPAGSQQTTPAAVPPTPEYTLASPCNCSCHQTQPPKPTQLPFSATEANQQCLQIWLLNFYRSTTFNTCDHHHLPLTVGVPMRLMVDPNAEPVSYHTTIPVPLHWQTDVKAGLDHEFSPGILKLVPVGELVTWYQCMVMYAKKNGRCRPVWFCICLWWPTAMGGNLLSTTQLLLCACS